MLLKEFLVSLGLDTDSASFAQGQTAVRLLEVGLNLIVGIAREAVTGFQDLVKETAAYGKETVYTAEEVGLTTQALQELRGAAVFTGVGVEQMETGLFHLARSMEAARRGGEQQAAAFHKLKVKVTGTDGILRDTDEILGELADNFAGMPPGLEKTALAMEIFGRSGARLIPILNRGRDGLRELRAEAYVMSPEDLENSKEVANLFDRIAMAGKSLLMGAIAPLMPEIASLLRNFLAWKKLNEAMLKQRLKNFFHDLIIVARGLSRAYQVLTNNADLIAYSLLALGAAFIYVKFLSTQAALATTAAWIEAAMPFLLIAGLIAGFLLIFDDIRQFALHGDKVDSLTGRFVKMLDEFTKPKSGDPWWLKTIREFADTIREALKLLHELNGDDKSTGPANANNVTAASPAFKRLNAMGPKTQAQVAREQTEEVQGRLDAESKAGFFEGIIWAMTRPTTPAFTGEPSSGSERNYNVVINANGMTPEEARPLIREELQSLQDRSNEDALQSVGQ